jgi:hypothetical protein
MRDRVRHAQARDRKRIRRMVVVGRSTKTTLLPVLAARAQAAQKLEALDGRSQVGEHDSR